MRRFFYRLVIRLAVTLFLINCAQSTIYWEEQKPNTIEQCHQQVPVEQWPDSCDGME